jgi:hypothetical protein
MTLLISIISAGTLKYNSISNFFNSILDGTANFTTRNTQVPEDSHKPTPQEQAVERKQMDDSDKEEEDTNEREDIIHRAIRIQLEKEERETKDAHIDSSHKTSKTDPVAVKKQTATGTAHPFGMKAPPVSEKEPLPNPEDTTSESGRAKDEL